MISELGTISISARCSRDSSINKSGGCVFGWIKRIIRCDMELFGGVLYTSHHALAGTTKSKNEAAPKSSFYK